MQGNGNDLRTLFRKLYFYLLPSSGMRSRYIANHRRLFQHLGNDVFWQPRNFPSDPELISIGNNVCLASGVTFVNHDVVSYMLNQANVTEVNLKPFMGCIKIGDNVMIGSNTMILPNVEIGSNVVIGAGSIVTKDLLDEGIYGGVPARKIGTIEKLLEKRIAYSLFPKMTVEDLWSDFEKQREK